MDRMENARAAQRMQEYMETHLTEPVTLCQLAAAAGYSPWHAERIFKEFTGRTPFDYLRSVRLTKAALALRDGGRQRILDVALDFVFDSQEGFTRAFSKEFGLPPVRYRRDKPPIPLFLPEKVYQVYRAFHKGGAKMENEKKTKAIFVQVIERPARKLLLKRGKQARDYFAYCEEAGCDVWAVLCSVKEALYEPVGLWLPDSLIPAGTSRYVQGVEVPMDYRNAVPDGFELIELPPCTMMVFQGEPYDDEDFQEAIGEVWAHLDRFDPALYGYEWAPQDAPRVQLAPMGYRGYIEARPVRAAEK